MVVLTRPSVVVRLGGGRIFRPTLRHVGGGGGGKTQVIRIYTIYVATYVVMYIERMRNTNPNGPKKSTPTKISQIPRPSSDWREREREDEEDVVIRRPIFDEG